MIQGTALVDAMLEVNPKNLGKGLYKMATRQKARDFVNKMPELEERVAGESALQDLQNSGKAKNKLINIGFKALSSIDKVVAGATAMGAYLDYAQQNDIDVDLDGDPDPDAMLHAQRAVEATQSNNQEKDKPLALSAGNLTGNKSVDNTLFQFQSFPMRRWAEFRVDAVANGLMGDGVDSKIDGARRIALITTAIALESGILMTLANAVQGEDEEDETFMGEMSRNAFQFVPLGGNLMSTVLYRSSPIPAVSFLNQSVRSVSGAVTAEEGDTRGRNAVEGLLQGIGVTTGLPGTIAQSRQVADRLFPEDNLPSQRGGGAFGDFGGFGEGGFDESSFEDTDFGGF